MFKPSLRWQYVGVLKAADKGWAIQHDPLQKPYAVIGMSPQKNVYCAGDSLQLEACTLGADHITWHLWDGTSDTSVLVHRVLPDSTVSVILEATNVYGTTSATQTIEISPLELFAPDIVLDCNQPTGTLTATTNMPATIWWVIGSDTIYGPFPPNLNLNATIFAVAQDEYGCRVSDQVYILLDTYTPFVTIEYNAPDQLLIAHSNPPGLIYQWTSNVLAQPMFGDSLAITASGTYTVYVTPSNGCTASTSISVVITAVQEPLNDAVRVVPNPASDFLKIENVSAISLQFKVLSALGQLQIVSDPIRAQQTSQIRIADLPAGLYWLIGYDELGKQQVFKKFLKS